MPVPNTPTHPAPPRVLLLPGWQNSGPGHWQSRWEQRHGFQRVDQHDWLTPRRGDWLARLDTVLVDTPGPVVLVAHSLGCVLVAAWARHSRHTGQVRGALLVAPGDVEAPALAPQLPGWAPIVRDALPFPSVLVGSQNDPYCSADRAQALARDWGSRWVDAGARGHLNAESGLGDWPEGLALIQPWLGHSPQPPGGSPHD
ncbi:alpha/beta hydrolase [Aquabacterium sp. A08]|uniref:RBBP9/YdeN family alpha/beta hydrolase n=1 Tax=Aquabacterium sp. A08 TaxID=2718532 RepID=UPI00141FCD68|nr:alpha/beta fold hydrolase [Aquabacterium sp. A08]NIC43738.1 serine hydrolase family protein [Aquabacterium sp. A08]